MTVIQGRYPQQTENLDIYSIFFQRPLQFCYGTQISCDHKKKNSQVNNSQKEFSNSKGMPYRECISSIGVKELFLGELEFQGW